MAKKGKQNVPLTDEEKAERKAARVAESRERFLKLAPKRVTKLQTASKHLAQCAGVGYVYTEAEANQLLIAAGEAMELLNDAFTKKPTTTDGFSFTTPSQGGCPTSGG